MPIKLKKTNIQYDLETPEKGWIILGVDEDGNLVKKDETGTYEKIVKEETYGIYLRLETDYLTIGNRKSDTTEGLYTLAQGNQIIAENIYSTAIGSYANSTGDFSYSRGQFLTADGNFSYVSGNGKSDQYHLKSSGVNSFVHTYVDYYSTRPDRLYGSFSDYSVILGGVNNLINELANYSVILGGKNNTINNGVYFSTIISCENVIATDSYTVYTTNIKNTNKIYTKELFTYNNETMIINNTITTRNIISDNLTSNYINTVVLSGQTSEFSNYVSSSAFKVIGYDNVSGFIKSNGTVDTSTYLRTSGGPNSKLTGDLISNKNVTFKNLIAPSTNLIMGYNSLLHINENNQLDYNVILGANNAQSLSSSGSYNIVLGTNNANVTTSGYTTVSIESFSNDILIGNNIKLLSKNTSYNEIVIGNDNTSRGNNTVLLGNGTTTKTYLMGTIYQNSVSIHPSDQRIKTEIKKLSDAELKAASQISKEIGLYNFLYDIKKGNNKQHIGLTVQKVIEILINNGLNPDDYDFININENFNEELDLYLHDNKIYGFNYNELILFIIAGIEQRLSDLENK